MKKNIEDYSLKIIAFLYSVIYFFI